MESFVDTILNRIAREKDSIGCIIDDRSLNRIPFHTYVVEYDKWTTVQNFIKTIFNEN